MNPAVVNISTTQTIRGGGPPRGQFGYPGMPMPNDPFRQFFDDFMGQGGGGGGEPMEQKVQSLGSGFIIDPEGLILTNFHVVQNATDIQVQLTEASKKTFKAKVVGSDRRTDIAVIKIDDHKLPSVALGDSDKVEVGEWVAAFGNPYGHGHSMTKGIISAKNRDIDLENASYPFLQTDASINPWAIAAWSAREYDRRSHRRELRIIDVTPERQGIGFADSHQRRIGQKDCCQL